MVAVAHRPPTATSSGSWSLASEATRAVITLVLFVVLARELQVQDYGTFVGLLAFASIFTPFASLGAGHVVIQAVRSRAADVGSSYAAAVAAAVFGGAVCSALVVVAGVLVFGLGALPLLCLLVCAEYFGSAIVELQALTSLAASSVPKMALKRTALGCCRLLALAVLTLLPAEERTALTWALLYLVASLLGALLSTWLTHREVPKHSVARMPTWAYARRGLLFSTNLSSAYVQDDLDKALVLHFAGAADAGLYTAGYRTMGLALVPLRASLTVLYPKFFEAGAQGSGATRTLLRRSAIVVAVYGVVAAAGTLLAAPLLDVALGKQYQSAELAVRWLSLVPLLRGLQYVLADALTGAGRQAARTVAQLAIGMANAALCALLVPRHGWHGALAATIATECLATVVLLSVVCALLRGEGRTRPAYQSSAPLYQAQTSTDEGLSSCG